MKKLLCTLLSIVCILAVVLAIAACNITEDAKIDNLVDKAMSIKSGNFTISLDMDNTTTKTIVHAKGNVSKNGVINADVMMSNDGQNSAGKLDSVTVVLVRDNTVYIVEGSDVAVVEDSFNKSIEAFLQENGKNFVKVGSLDEFITDELPNYGGMDNVESLLTADQQAVLETLSNNMLKYIFNKLTETEDGYTLSIDVEKHVLDLWDKVYAVAQMLDEKTDMTIGQLYKSNEFNTIIAPFLKNISGQQVENLLRTAAEAEGQVSVEILEANKRESAYDYIGRYLDVKTNDQCLADQKVVDTLKGLVPELASVPSFAKYMQDNKYAFLQTVSPAFNLFDLELYFNQKDQFTGAYFATEIEENKVSLKVNLTKSVVLTDTSNFTYTENKKTVEVTKVNAYDGYWVKYEDTKTKALDVSKLTYKANRQKAHSVVIYYDGKPLLTLQPQNFIQPSIEANCWVDYNLYYTKIDGDLYSLNDFYFGQTCTCKVDYYNSEHMTKCTYKLTIYSTNGYEGDVLEGSEVASTPVFEIELTLTEQVLVLPM